MSDNIFEKMTEEERTQAWIYMILGKAGQIDKERTQSRSRCEGIKAEKENELKLRPCYCGGKIEMKKVAKNGGMDETYYDWQLTCKKCGLTMTYAADGFYGRKYKTLEEVVDDWSSRKKK